MNERLHVCLVGPAEPAVLHDLLDVDGPVPDGIGGIPVNDLARELVRLGHPVTLVTHSPAVHQVWRARGPLLAVSVVPSRERPRSRALDFFSQERRGISAEVRAARPDVVHAHWTYEFALGALAARTAPVLVTARDLPWTILRSFRDPYRFIRWTMAWHVRASVRNLSAASPYAADGWRREMLYRRPIALIPNPTPSLPASSVVRSADPTILSVGDSSPRKNVKTLLAAFGLVLSTIPSSQLRLVGNGLGAHGELAEWARAHDLDKQVSFIGPLSRSALADEYARSTVYCHPSLEETFGNVLLEALSAGLPVVAGDDAGAVGWVLFEGRAGRLVDVSDAEQLAEALLGAIQEPTSTVAAGFDLKAELQSHYSLGAVAQRYVDEYHRILRDSRGRKPT